MTQITVKNTKKVPNTHFKLNIKQRLATVSAIKAKNIKEAVQAKTNKSRSSIYRIINCQHTDSIVLDADVLKAFAKAFDCSIEDLYNVNL